MSNLRSLPICILAGILFCGSVLTAQSSNIAPRITAAVNESSLTTLKGNVPMRAQAKYDQGEASSSTQLTHMRLVLSRSSEQEAALDTYLAELQDKSSSNYHKWLTPAQFGALYGPANSDVAALVAWLQSHGLKLEAVSAGRTNISFSGTASQVEEAFHTPIHTFAINGETFYSNTANPKIPAALSSVVKGIAHLSTFKPRPLAVRGRPGKLDLDSHQLVPVSSSSSSARSQLTITSSSKYYLYLVPGDAATIYNTPNTTFNANYTSGTSYTGSGVTIGIGGDAAISTTPVVNYRTKFLGDSTAPTTTNVDGVTDTTDADEAYLDVEISGGLAPGATIHYYPSSDLDSGIEQAINENTVDIFSLSYGSCELDLTTSENAQIEGWWKQAAAQGIAVAVSSGDSGSAGCDDPNEETEAEYGLQVNGLGSTPYNISVGGTDFALTQSNFTTYASTSDSSSTYYRSAKRYIPETTWNDSTSTNTTYSLDVPSTSSTTGKTNIWAGSGGKSNCATNSSTDSTVGSCTAGWPKPSWQRGTGVPSDSVRDLPDVSLMSGDNYAAWLVCTNDTSDNITANCSETSDEFYFYGFGGTSTATPAFAGILALVQQSQGGGRLGQAAANLYNIYNNSTSASSIFHDITTGNNSVPCLSSSSYGGCTENSAGYYFMTGYNTTTGYDLATGLGSIDAAKLITNWSSGLGSTIATVAVSPSSSSITTSNALALTVTVTGSSNTPSGSVYLSDGSGYTSSTVNLDSGSATITIAAGALAAGNYTLTAYYSGDGIYASATGAASVAVTTSTLTSTTTALTPLTTTSTYGTSVALTATVTPTAAAGTVNFYEGSTLLGTGTLSSGSATFSSTTLPIGTDTITATYEGNTTYASSTSNSVTVTVSSSSTSGGSGSGGTGTTTITVTPSGGYTGTVEFGLYTTSTYLLNYACYDISNATVSSTSAVSETLTLYTGEANCSSNSIQSGKVHAFKQAKTVKIASNPTAPITEAAFTSLGLLLAGFIGWRFRKARAFCCVLALMVMSFALSSCGGGSSSSTTTATKSFALSVSPSTVTVSAGTSGIPTGSYSMTVEGDDSSSSSLTATTNLTLTVD
jgi:hypothetical protein